MNEKELENSTIKSKDAATIVEQLKTLKNRGLIIKNEKEAVRFLKRVSYYRLSGYFRQFYKPDQYEEFKDGLDFATVANLYRFDAKLRIILFELIAELEVSLKALLSDKLGCNHGKFAWCDEKNYDMQRTFIDRKTGKTVTYFETIQKTIKHRIERARKEPFVQHHIKQYNQQFPVWVLMEIIDFGDTSKIYKNLTTPIQKEIKREINEKITQVQLESWLEQIVKCRNICAHHGRLVAKENFKIKKHTEISQHNAKGFFALLIAIRFLITDIEIWEQFVEKLDVLNKKFNVDLKMLALPDDWKSILK